MAKVGKIRPGGMCRLPSSRLVADGMASESLNLVAELEETAPVLPPSLLEGEDIPESWREGNGEMVFVHTRPSYENHIFLVGQGIGTWAKEGDVWVFTAFMEMAEGETLNSIVGIGNTLVVSTSEATHYVLWKDGTYRDLGTELPRPAVQFYGNELHQVMGDTGTFPGNHMCSADRSDSHKAEKNSDGEYDDDEITRRIWAAYDDTVAEVAEINKKMSGRVFYQPYLFRYALRLYDGTYARQSVPVLVGGAAERPLVLGTYEYSSSLYGGATVWLYYATAQLLERIPEDWGDIVTAVDIFCSSPINLVDPGDGGIRKGGTLEWYMGGESGRTVTLYGERSDSQIESGLLNYNVCYRLGSFLVDGSAPSFDDDYDPAQEFTANQEDLVNGIRLKKPDADTLVTHTSTASGDWDDYNADHNYRGNCQKAMNQRLAIWDITQILGPGLGSLNSATAKTTVLSSPGYGYNGDADVYEWRFAYEVETDDGRVWTRGAYADGGTDFRPLAALPFNGTDPDGVAGYAPAFLRVFGWLAYPDAKCRRVMFSRRLVRTAYGSDVFTEGDWSDPEELAMREHPFLNCAYAWLGFGKELSGGAVSEDDRRAFWDLYADGWSPAGIRIDNRIMLSGVSNPFTFPASGYYDFDYAVVSCATANMPLSTGQFGQFPLYVFTKGGIWAMSMNADGTFASSSPFSRDVALSHRGVCEIDQGIIFIAEKAVLAIQGGQITDISQLMGGRHDTLPDSAVDALGGSGYGKDGVTVGDLSPAWTDGSAFMAFMADAEAGYDYKGDRMVFINGDYVWQWVWMRKSSTWHRTMLHGGDYGMPEEGAVRVVSSVNSWPGLAANLATAGEEPLRAVGEMTSQLDRTRGDDLSATGLYVSRPLTFDTPDVFKSITDLRIRGDLKRGNARHLLLSSNNGRDWVLRKSLRGPSFRFHRIVVATRMTTAERLSYIETQYEERFTNRLR